MPLSRPTRRRRLLLCEAGARMGQLDDAQTVGKAQGLLIQQQHISPASAERVLQEQADDLNRPLVEVAEALVAEFNILRDH